MELVHTQNKHVSDKLQDIPLTRILRVAKKEVKRGAIELVRHGKEMHTCVSVNAK